MLIQAPIKRGMLITLTKEYIIKEREFLGTNSNVQQGPRPYLVVQNNLGNMYSSTLTVVPITQELKKPTQATHSTISCLKSCSMTLCEMIKTIDCHDIKSVIGMLSQEEMEKVDQCLAIQLGLQTKDEEDVSDGQLNQQRTCSVNL